MSWKDYFIRKKIRELSAIHQNRAGQFKAMAEVQQILLLVNEEDQQDLSGCIDKLKRMDKRVSIGVFSSKNMDEEANSLLVHLCGKKDRNFFLFPSQQFLEKINDVKADLIIDLTRPDNLTAQYVLLQHPCRFKTGFKHANLDLYDLSVVVTDRKNLKQIFEHLLFYLNSIRSK